MRLRYLAAILLIVGNISCASNRATQTSSARAAYGTPAPLRAHVKKNKKAKKKAQKKKKNFGNQRPYRTLPM